MKARLTLCSLCLAVLAAGCSTPIRSANFSLSYEDLKLKLSEMRVRRSVSHREPVPGQYYTLRLFERGDPKFGTRTWISVTRLSETNCHVELETTRYSFLMGSIRVLHTERSRWKEVKKLLRDSNGNESDVVTDWSTNSLGR